MLLNGFIPVCVGDTSLRVALRNNRDSCGVKGIDNNKKATVDGRGRKSVLGRKRIATRFPRFGFGLRRGNSQVLRKANESFSFSWHEKVFFFFGFMVGH